VHSGERARHSYWLHRRDQIIHRPVMNQKVDVALARPAAVVPSTEFFWYPALHFKGLFHFPTRRCELAIWNEENARQGDENRMIVTRVRLAQTSSLSPPLELVISAGPDGSIPYGRLVRNNKFAGQATCRTLLINVPSCRVFRGTITMSCSACNFQVSRLPP
jgi:hypothetical protein